MSGVTIVLCVRSILVVLQRCVNNIVLGLVLCVVHLILVDRLFMKYLLGIGNSSATV